MKDLRRIPRVQSGSARQQPLLQTEKKSATADAQEELNLLERLLRQLFEDVGRS